MVTFVVMLVIYAGLHFLVHLPALIAGGVVVALWIVWKLKYFILAAIGLEMLLGD